MKNTLLNKIDLISHFFNESGLDCYIDDVLCMDNLPSYWEMYENYMKYMREFTELTRIHNIIDYRFDYKATKEVKDIKGLVIMRLRSIAKNLERMGFKAHLFDGRTNCHIIYTNLIKRI